MNLPEAEKGRWGTGLTADDMKKCVWVRPEAVARIEYLEWTEGDHLRHAKFDGLHDDESARQRHERACGRNLALFFFLASFILIFAIPARRVETSSLPAPNASGGLKQLVFTAHERWCIKEATWARKTAIPGQEVDI